MEEYFVLQKKSYNIDFNEKDPNQRNLIFGIQTPNQFPMPILDFFVFFCTLKNCTVEQQHAAGDVELTPLNRAASKALYPHNLNFLYQYLPHANFKFQWLHVNLKVKH